MTGAARHSETIRTPRPVCDLIAVRSSSWSQTDGNAVPPVAHVLPIRARAPRPTRFNSERDHAPGHFRMRRANLMADASCRFADDLYPEKHSALQQFVGVEARPVVLDVAPDPTETRSTATLCDRAATTAGWIAPPTSVHGHCRSDVEIAGGAGGARTHDRRIMRSTATCTGRTACTDTTEPCH